MYLHNGHCHETPQSGSLQCEWRNVIKIEEQTTLPTKGLCTIFMVEKPKPYMFLTWIFQDL
ncbi:hypothetical protein V1478_008057 [Vespula squamosa]|uniref:Uncharacterized protein n=1 Tax=Vespula squamosa TaxID=30214 RepID=A0ABD2AXN9_VESSQ